MTTEQRIEANFYEHEWVIAYAGRDGFTAEELDALVAVGKLKCEATVYCPEGHSAWVGPKAEAEKHRGDCMQCFGERFDGGGDPDDYEVKAERYVMTDEWRATLKRNVRDCEHCGGSGRIFPRASHPGEER
jgi:hypothetical protein